MKKNQFHLPDGVIYLDGNSLGPLPKAAIERIQKTVVDEWGDMLITAWNSAGWFQQPNVLGNRLAPLIGAATDTVVLGDTLSIKVFQALAAGLQMRPDRNVILSDKGNFPTDLYIAEGLIKLTGRDIQLKLVEPEEVADSLDEGVAVMMLTEVDYKTGRMHSMSELTRKAHSVGAVALWDLAHSAGAIPVDLQGCNPEFAVGCTYKYLNAGPGAPAFIYTRPDLGDIVEPALCGWMGHASPFAFDKGYKPAPSISRMRVGTPPVLQMAALDAALDIWDDVSIDDVRKKSIELSELFIKEIELRCPQLRLISPRDSKMRGSQVSFTWDNGFEAIKALAANGVIGDFRAPDVMRFGFTPLYLDEHDVMKAIIIIEKIINENIWAQEQFKRPSSLGGRAT